MSVTIQLTPTRGSFSFDAKTIPLPRDAVVILGAETTDDSRSKRRRALPDNGWFAPRRPITMASLAGGVAPPLRSSLSLGLEHAKIWYDGRMVYIEDLKSGWETVVNGEIIKGAVVLRPGDTICLGRQITRNQHTPEYITDDELKPIAAFVSISEPAD